MSVTEVAPKPAPKEYSFASPTLGAHLRRGLTSFGLLVVAAATWSNVGWIAVMPAAAGVVALRGCPMCWTVGLIQTVSRGRFRRDCTQDGCSLVDTRGGVPSPR